MFKVKNVKHNQNRPFTDVLQITVLENFVKFTEKDNCDGEPRLVKL